MKKSGRPPSSVVAPSSVIGRPWPGAVRPIRLNRYRLWRSSFFKVKWDALCPSIISSCIGLPLLPTMKKKEKKQIKSAKSLCYDVNLAHKQLLSDIFVCLKILYFISVKRCELYLEVEQTLDKHELYISWRTLLILQYISNQDSVWLGRRSPTQSNFCFWWAIQQQSWWRTGYWNNRWYCLTLSLIAPPLFSSIYVCLCLTSLRRVESEGFRLGSFSFIVEGTDTQGVVRVRL